MTDILYAVLRIQRDDQGLLAETLYEDVGNWKEAEGLRLDALKWYSNDDPQNIIVIQYKL